MPSTDFSWSIPIMRAGYAGRGLVYLVVAGFSLYAIWLGGQAQGTSSALEQLENTGWGMIVLFLIFLGMVAYAIWRLIDAYYDLEDYGTETKGLVARAGMLVTGLVHLAIGFSAFTLLFAGGGGGGDSETTITDAVATVMGWPAGRWIVAIVGLIILGAGGYYVHKAWKEKYREELRANHFTEQWNFMLKAGLAAQGAIIAIIGGLFLYAAWRANPDEAGGLDGAFDWLTGQPYGQVLVAAVCVGLLGFALFCFVNAACRIIPKAEGDDIETLGARLEAKARQAMG
jgi:hypothetical protein